MFGVDIDNMHKTYDSYIYGQHKVRENLQWKESSVTRDEREILLSPNHKFEIVSISKEIPDPGMGKTYKLVKIKPFS